MCERETLSERERERESEGVLKAAVLALTCLAGKAAGGKDSSMPAGKCGQSDTVDLTKVQAKVSKNSMHWAIHTNRDWQLDMDTHPPQVSPCPPIAPPSCSGAAFGQGLPGS